MLDLLLGSPGVRGRQAALEKSLRDAITSGRLRRGTRVPSTRSLAAELGVSRSTVVGAYDQLVAEGLLTATRGAGTRVGDVPAAVVAGATTAPRTRSRFDADFRPGEPDRSSFPRHAWHASMRRGLADAPDDLFGYGDPRGTWKLRSSLAAYLGRSRAVRADPSQIIIFSRFGQALSILAEVFGALGVSTLAVEDPALPFHPLVCERAGLDVVAVPVDDAGMRIDLLRRTAATVALVTPAHQYPLGVVLGPDRRVDLVAWAGEVGGWVVEDDYDGEFRYDRQPIGAMQGLDPTRVIYGGTASKCLAAGLHIGWLVVPPELVEPVTEAARWRVGVSTVEQAALADFIDRGLLDRHVRQMRLRYRRRRDMVLRAFTEHAPLLTMTGVSAGLQGSVLLPGRPDIEDEVMAQAAAMSVGLHPLRVHRRSPGPPGVVIGWSRLAEHELGSAFERFAQLLSVLPRSIG